MSEPVALPSLSEAIDNALKDLDAGRLPQVPPGENSPTGEGQSPQAIPSDDAGKSQPGPQSQPPGESPSEPPSKDQLTAPVEPPTDKDRDSKPGEVPPQFEEEVIEDLETYYREHILPQMRKAQAEGKIGGVIKALKTFAKKAIAQYRALRDSMEEGAEAEVDIEQLQQQLQEYQSRIKELEDRLATVAYERSPEFVEKYDKPLQDAIGRIAQELEGYTIQDANGTERTLTINDIIRVAMMPSGQAREQISQWCQGDSITAYQLLQWRNELANLINARSQALQNAAQRFKEYQERQLQELQQRLESVNTEIAGYWERALQGFYENPFVQQLRSLAENDPELNNAFEHGKRVTTEALRANLYDPDMTPDKRARATAALAGVYMRSTLYSVLVQAYKRALNRIKQLESEIGQYKQPPTTPASGTGATTAESKLESFEEAFEREFKKLFGGGS